MGEIRETLSAIDKYDEAPTRIQPTKERNEEVVDIRQIETYFKQVNDIYMKTWAEGKNEFEVEQLNQLRIVAALCPYQGGSSVRRARVMLAQIDGMEYDDGQCDLSQAIYMKNDSNALKNNNVHIKVHPNPAFKSVYLQFTGTELPTSQFSLINVLGHVALDYDLPAKSKSVEIPLLDIANGTYYYRIKSDQKEFERGKLVILR